MKDAEDEAFDDLAKRQGHWGGGFMAKKAMAADKLQEPVREALKLADIIEHFDGNDESLPLELLKEIAATLRALAQPVQEPVACLDCGSHNVGIPATYDSLINSVKALNT